MKNLTYVFGTSGLGGIIWLLIEGYRKEKKK